MFNDAGKDQVREMRVASQYRSFALVLIGTIGLYSLARLSNDGLDKSPAWRTDTKEVCPPRPAQHTFGIAFSPVLKRMSKRRESLLAQCATDVQFAQVNTCVNDDYWPSEPLRTHIMIDENHRLAGCLVEKSGSSSWHQVFWNLRTPTSYADLNLTER